VNNKGVIIMKNLINRTKGARLWALLAVFLAVSSWAIVDNLSFSKTANDETKIDWENGYISVIGKSAPITIHVNPSQAKALATRAAVMDAQRKLKDAINEVIETSKLSGKEPVSNLDDKIDELVKGMNVLQLKYLADGSAWVRASLPLRGTGGVGEILFKGETKKGVSDEDEGYSEIDVPSVAEIGQMRTEEDFEGGDGEVYTGLIVDASGTDFQPAMSPQIHTQSGDEIYGTLDVSPDFASGVGIAGYANSVQEAKDDNSRVGNNPLVVKAINAKGPFNADAVISNQDGKILKDAVSKVNFLKKCKVIIVTQ
jgi:hypothetical protein